MTIHHDKLAYGKLASTQESVSEDRLAEMLKKLNGNPNPEEGQPQEEQEEKNKKKKKQ